MERKSLYDISWQVDEPTYRADKALSYSTISKFERTGFNELDHLFDKLDTASLVFGSAVDSLITGGQKEFDERFMVAEFPSIPDSIVKIVCALFEVHSQTKTSLITIPDIDVIGCASNFEYQNNWKPETRAKVIKEKGSAYYNLLYLAGDKKILSTETYQDVLNAVEALKNKPSTKIYFAEDNPFEPHIERLYQLKFKANIYGIDYRNMAD